MKRSGIAFLLVVALCMTHFSSILTFADEWEDNAEYYVFSENEEWEDDYTGINDTEDYDLEQSADDTSYEEYQLDEEYQSDDLYDGYTGQDEEDEYTDDGFNDELAVDDGAVYSYPDEEYTDAELDRENIADDDSVSVYEPSESGLEIQVEEEVMSATESAEMAADSALLASGSCGENANWSLTEDGILTISGSGDMYDYPASTNDLPWGKYGRINSAIIQEIRIEEGITSIGKHAFYDLGMKKVTLPSSLLSIHEKAFSECEELESVFIPRNVREIAPGAFANSSYWLNTSRGNHFANISVSDENEYFTSIDGILYNKELNTLVLCPSGKEDIDIFTFPESVVRVEDYAFHGCAYLRNVIFSDYITEIGAFAFVETNISEITIPETVTYLGGCAFSGCHSLTKVRIDGPIGCLESMCFAYCENLSEVIISQNLKDIEGNVFRDCASLESITFSANPSGLRFSSYQTFENCTDLKSINFRGTYEQWEELVTDPNGCIPQTIRIYFDTQGSSGSLVKGYCGDNVSWRVTLDGLLCISGTGSMYDYARANATEPNSKIAPWLEAYRSKIKDVAIEEGVTSIGNNAFDCCTSLETISISSSVSSLDLSAEKLAWFGCDALKQITVNSENSTYTTVGGILYDKSKTALLYIPAAFDKAIVPATVTSIGRLYYGINLWFAGKAPSFAENAFSGKSDSESISIYYKGSDSTWETVAGKTFGGTNISWVKVEDVYIASGDCGESANWTLTDSGILTVFGTGEMDDYSSVSQTPWYSYGKTGTNQIKEIVIEEGITSVGAAAFENVGMLKVTLPSSLLSIHENAFAQCQYIDSFYIPENVQDIAAGAIYGCASPKGTFGGAVDCQFSEFLVSAGNKSYAARDGILYSKDMTTLVSCPAGKSGDLSLPGTVTRISKSGFFGCGYITHISLPDSINEIDYRAFHRSGIEEIVVPDGVACLRKEVFMNCPALSEVTLPESLSVIEERTFLGCSKLTSITFPDSLTTIKSGAFEGTGLSELIIPENVTYVGAYAFKACKSLSTVKIHGKTSGIYTVFAGSTSIENIWYPESEEKWINLIENENDSTLGPVEEEYGPVLKNATIHFGDIGNSGTVARGNCGQSAYWKLNQDGLLRVYGSGSMYDYVDLSGNEAASRIVPWYSEYRSRIKKCVVEEGILSIGSNSLYGCTSLESIAIPASVESIDISDSGNIWKGCTALNQIVVSDDNNVFSSIDGVLYDKTAESLLYVPGRKTEVVVPRSVKNFRRVYPSSSVTLSGEAECALAVWFQGDAPVFSESAFAGDQVSMNSVIAFYDADNETWSESALQNYGGKSVTWKKWKPNIAEYDITLEKESFQFTGQAIEPEVSIKLGYPSVWLEVLKINKDFTLEYKNNTNPGVASVIVKGIGRYFGEKELHFDITEQLLDRISYNFSNSHKGFGYPEDYFIPLRNFQRIYGVTALADKLYLVQKRKIWNGNCYGMSSTASMMITGNEGITPATFRDAAAKVGDLAVGDTSSDYDMTVRDFIESMHVSQLSLKINQTLYRNMNHINEMASLVENYMETRKPVLLAVYGSGGGHALVGYSIEKIDEQTSRLHVYDCNYPMEDRYITLYGSAGNYTGWHYLFNKKRNWGSEYGGCRISFVSYDDFVSCWEERGNDQNPANLMVVNSGNISIFDVEDHEIARLEDGELYTESNNIMKIEELDWEADGTYYIYLPENRVYTVENNEGSTDNFEISLTHVDHTLEVVTNAASVSMVVSDKEKIVETQVNADEGQSYEISLLSSDDNDDYNNITVKGVGTGNDVMLSQSAGVLSMNIKDAKMTLDGKAVNYASVVSSSTKGGTITPSGTSDYMIGDSAVFKITPDSGYIIQDVKVDGSSVGAVNSYSFEDIKKDHVIKAEFAKKPVPKEYTVKASTSKGGVISPSGVLSYTAGKDAAFKIKPAAGYVIKSVNIDGKSIGVVNQYTFTKINKNRKIYVSFMAHTAHKWGKWVITKEATALKAGAKYHECSVCKKKETATVAKLKPTYKTNATTLLLKVGQSTKNLKIWGFAKGDYVKKRYSTNTKIVTVNSKGVVKGIKAGSAYVCFNLASGFTAKVKVVVQKNAVAATSITGVAKTSTLKKGKTMVIKPGLKPITCVQKISYTSSNSKIASVSSTGVVKGIKAGTAKITVKAGNVKTVMTVKVVN